MYLIIANSTQWQCTSLGSYIILKYRNVSIYTLHMYNIITYIRQLLWSRDMIVNIKVHIELNTVLNKNVISMP